MDFANATLDVSVGNLKAQFTDLAFQSDTGGIFSIGFNFNQRFKQNIGDDDFTLSSTTYHSPGPLPIFGLATAFFFYEKKLKRKYKSQS